jgi:3-deoxy-D-manno-octulosonic-acid transferase
MATLQQSGGLVTVQTPAALAEQVALWLTDPDRRISAGRSGAEAVIANRGATERVLALLRSRILLAQGD